MRTISAFLAVPAAGLAASLFPASAHAIGDAPAVCDVARSHASAVFDASNAFTDVLNRNSDPTAETSQTQFRTTRADLIHKLHDEVDAIDGQEAPANFQAAVKRYTTAERKFADVITQDDLDSFQPSVDERNSAQHAFFAQCNDAIGNQPGSGKSSQPGEADDSSPPASGE